MIRIFKYFGRLSVPLRSATAIVAAGAIAAVVLLLNRPRPIAEVRYGGSSSKRLLFHAQETGATPVVLKVEKFVLSTLKFGKVGYDKFEVQFPENRTILAGTGPASIVVAEPVGAQSYLCSQLRSIGFFLDYGPLKNGRLPDRFTVERMKRIAGDLRCSFTISEAESGNDYAGEYGISSPCDQITWIDNCVISALSEPN